MDSFIINAGIVLLTFTGMELTAYLAHRFVMHGLLWKLHEDHHRRTHTSFFERNDFFFLMFATPGILCLYVGAGSFSPVFWIGAGITLYGAAYFFIHDIFIHQRLKVMTNTKLLYFVAIRRAHKAHHKHLGKYNGENFGMLWAAPKYYAEARKLLAR